MRENGPPRKSFHGSLRSCPEDFHRRPMLILERTFSASPKTLTGAPFGALVDPPPTRWLHKKRALTTFQDKVNFVPSMAERIGVINVANPK
jgi:hypothetical protein